MLCPREPISTLKPVALPRLLLLSITAPLLRTGPAPQQTATQTFFLSVTSESSGFERLSPPKDAAEGGGTSNMFKGKRWACFQRWSAGSSARILTV